MIKELFKIIKKGILEENAVFALALGLCPILAVSTTAKDGFGMGMALIFVLTASVFISSLIRDLVSDKVRIPAYITVIASFVTITDMVLKAYFPPLAKSLGIYVPLIVVNCIVLGRVEAFAIKNPPLKAASDGIGMGLGFTLAIVFLASIREVLGFGTLFGIPVLPPAYKPVIMMILPAGGFITIGLIMGIIAYLKSRPRCKPIEKNQE